MPVGTIRNLISGFGFILPEGAQSTDRSLSFQRSDLEGVTYENLQVGQQVEYEVVTGQAQGMLKASEVRLRPAPVVIENIQLSTSAS